MVTRYVEFSFNDVIYQKTDGIAMGSPSARPLLTFLLAIMSQNSSIHFLNPLCTTAAWMKLSLCLTMNENVIVS